MCCTCSQSAISELTFPIFFTRSLSFWTAPCGDSRSFQTVSNRTKTRDCTENAMRQLAYQHCRIFLPRQCLHDRGICLRSEIRRKAAHNQEQYTSTLVSSAGGMEHQMTSNRSFPAHHGVGAALLFSGSSGLGSHDHIPVKAARGMHNMAQKGCAGRNKLRWVQQTLTGIFLLRLLGPFWKPKLLTFTIGLCEKSEIASADQTLPLQTPLTIELNSKACLDLDGTGLIGWGC